MNVRRISALLLLLLSFYVGGSGGQTRANQPLRFQVTSSNQQKEDDPSAAVFSATWQYPQGPGEIH
jgi:hypothetical protein